MKLLISPIQASDYNQRGVKLQVSNKFILKKLDFNYVYGTFEITIHPKPANNPVVFRQYELRLPNTIKILEYTIPRQLVFKQEQINNDYIRILIKPNNKVLIIDNQLKIYFAVKIVPLSQDSKYSVFIIPKISELDSLQQLAPNNSKDLHTFVTYAPVNEDYIGIALINSNNFQEELLQLQEIVNKIPLVLSKVLIVGAYYFYKKILIIVLSISLILYNIVWILKQIRSYRLKQ